MTKLTRISSVALMALATPLALHAGTEMKDSKDMKQTSQTEYGSDAGFYVAVYGGTNFSTNYGDRHTSFGPGGAATPDNIHSEVGETGGIKGGYNFESFPVCDGLRLQPAVEVDAMYIGMDSSAQNNTGVGSVRSSTSWNNAAGFVNGILRFKLTNSGSFFSRLTPYIGVGVGAEYLSTHTHLNVAGGNVGGVSDDDVDFAAEGLVGLDYNLNQHWTLFTEYKFVDAIGADFNSSTAAGTYRFAPNQIQQNLATLGVKYNF